MRARRAGSSSRPHDNACVFGFVGARWIARVAQSLLLLVAGGTTGADLVEWMLELTRASMKEFYDSVWGWSDANKRKELLDEVRACRCDWRPLQAILLGFMSRVQSARFIIARDTLTGTPVGFIHFRSVVSFWRVRLAHVSHV